MQAVVSAPSPSLPPPPPGCACAPARYDALPRDVAAPRGARNAALLSALDRLQGEGALLALGRDGPDTTGLTVLRAALAGEAELVRAGWRVRAGPSDSALAARVMGRLAQPESANTEGTVLQALGKFCAAAVAAYPSALQADMEEIAELEQQQRQRQQQPGSDAMHGYLRLQVLRALASEKRALAGTAAAVAEWQELLANGSPLIALYDGLEGE